MAKRRGCKCICARKFPQSTGISVGMFNWVLQRYLFWPHGLDNRSYVYFRLFHPWSTIVVGRYRFPLCWLLSSSKLRLHILRLAKSPNKDTERLETKTWVFFGGGICRSTQKKVIWVSDYKFSELCVVRALKSNSSDNFLAKFQGPVQWGLEIWSLISHSKCMGLNILFLLD